ncbi:Acetylornithine aminotransferase [Agromyces marinus]|uniref:Acetylornithine aminotransferase n=2 Tax=Agromyces marinus TaxID=1389020 RepID=A0ABM8GY16_9MICO|nr:acetylornithine transaminase [Agromyces marinus]UIP58352.1 Acetylornithine aminotransferase [Agromyces marinus]BDZ53395.1 acetylornithine aminotransferase [Agromyces marinus]
MSGVDWREHYSRRMMRTLGMPLAKLERGEGAWVFDDEGTRYLDFLAGIAVNSLGHAHPVFVDAVSTQAARLAHVSNYFATQPALDLADRLTRLAGAGERGRVWFGNSGAEANEAAFKLARLNNSGGARTRVLALVDAFHGRTMGSLALTGKPAMRDAFEPLPGGVTHLPSTIEALEGALDDSVAALVLEPVKGEAGVLELPDGYLQAARELTRRHGALLIIDEVQTGAGRTGEWFAFQHAGIVPDAITVAKGIGGGIPIGGLITFDGASELYAKGQHGSTFGGNPLATAVADAVLAEIERADLVGNAERRGAELRDRIDRIGSPLVAGTRGLGLLAGVALTEPVAAQVSAAALEAGLIVNAANDSTIRLAPPLIIGDTELDVFEERFAGALATVAASL